MFKQHLASDPKVIPRLSATIILIRDTDEGVKVLLMRRNSKLNFCAGMWVFPGGAVDDKDALNANNGENEAEILKFAAVRETLEEAGIVIDIDDLLPVSRWVTPQGVAKRFDTAFFLAAVNDASVCVDGSEIVDSLWVTPAEAIAKHRAQDVEFLPPTLISLMGIAAFETVDEVLAHYKNKPINNYLPKVSFLDEQLIMLYPGDNAYESGRPEDDSAMHRCVYNADGWQYINTIGVQL